MDLDEGMSYGTRPARPGRQRRRVGWVTGGAATVALLGLAVYAAVGGASPREPVHAPAPAPAAATSAPAHAPAASPTPDAAISDPSAEATLVRFVEGWRSTSQAERTAIFAETATKDLTARLGDVDPYKTVAAEVTRIEPGETTPYAAAFRVHFEGVDAPMIATLSADPETEWGWVMTGIDQEGPRWGN